MFAVPWEVAAQYLASRELPASVVLGGSSFCRVACKTLADIGRSGNAATGLREVALRVPSLESYVRVSVLDQWGLALAGSHLMQHPRVGIREIRGEQGTRYQGQGFVGVSTIPRVV